MSYYGFFVKYHLLMKLFIFKIFIVKLHLQKAYEKNLEKLI